MTALRKTWVLEGSGVENLGFAWEGLEFWDPIWNFGFVESRFSLPDNLKDFLRKIGSAFEGFLFRLGHFGFIEVEKAPALFFILFKNNAFCSAMFFSRIFS